MGYFRILVSGSGIALAFGNEAPAIGFYTTRFIKAENSAQAEQLAKDLVLSEWRPGSAYAAANKGALPLLVIESVVPASTLAGYLKRHLKGYSFYQND